MEYRKDILMFYLILLNNKKPEHQSLIAMTFNSPLLLFASLIGWDLSSHQAFNLDMMLLSPSYLWSYIQMWMRWHNTGFVRLLCCSCHILKRDAAFEVGFWLLWCPLVFSQVRCGLQKPGPVQTCEFTHINLAAQINGGPSSGNSAGVDGIKNKWQLKPAHCFKRFVFFQSSPGAHLNDNVCVFILV